MKSLVVTDKDIPLDLFKNSVIVNLNNMQYSFCTGGLSCLKNEGPCRFKDDMSTISQWMNDSSLLIFITKVVYGVADIPLKKMMERMVVNQEPYYTLEEGKTVHLSVSQNKKKFLFIGYGDINEEEEKLFREQLEADTITFNYSSYNAYICKENELEETLRAFGGVDHE